MIMDHSRRDRMAGFLKLARGRMVLDPRSAGLVAKSWSCRQVFSPTLAALFRGRGHARFIAVLARIFAYEPCALLAVAKGFMGDWSEG
jgi:hypothetical protein